MYSKKDLFLPYPVSVFAIEYPRKLLKTLTHETLITKEISKTVTSVWALIDKAT